MFIIVHSSNLFILCLLMYILTYLLSVYYCTFRHIYLMFIIVHSDIFILCLLLYILTYLFYVYYCTF